MQDPELYLADLDLELPCVMDPETPAFLEPDHRSCVNWEIYFFSSHEQKRRFDADPLRHYGIVTDPVTRRRFYPGTASPRIEYGGRPYFFLSDESLHRFQEDPAMYAIPDLEMRPREEGPETPADPEAS